MKPVNRIFIRVATEDSRKLKLNSGLELFFDDSYNENWNRQQIGQIAYLPDAIKDKYKLKEGDIIYFHHLATIADHKVNIKGETLYMQPIEQIFAVKRGDKIVCLPNIVFVEQMKEPEENARTKSGIWLKEKADEIKRHGTVIAIPEDVSDWIYLDKNLKFTKKLKLGSHVIFKDRSEYQINADFGQRKVYKMRLENILAVM